MARRTGGCLTAVALVLALAVVALGGALLWLVATGGEAPRAPWAQDAGDEGDAGDEAPRSFADYSWDELADAAEQIAAAPTDEEGRAVAERCHIAVGDTRTATLDSGLEVRLTVVGIRADERADGGGPAGLTIMTSPIASRPMNDEPTNEGGWEGSDARAWLASEGLDLLPDDLAARVVPVTKRTNNAGVTSDAASVSETDDALWLFSASEVCGPLSWFSDEYGSSPNLWTGYVDFTAYDALLSAEGAQYEYFSQAGVTGESDPGGALAQTLSGTGVAWWYRTSYPYSFTGDDASFFYQVMASGYPGTTGLASEPAGIVAGFCL